ncbi:MAG: class I SAM-dependent methyltransferase [Desulfobulbaceae bacterium]|nr:class I SAM-dependent methyltransferase [Desulfobulbaceae bacterium]
MDQPTTPDPRGLKAGDPHYQAYVGPPEQYDFMGATQFRLLCALGLRAHHSLLDVGCGSLRAGRLFISYLDPDHYFGIEPNRWLIEAAITNQLGQDQLRIKNPRFAYNSNFSTAAFNEKYDFILAQSIFSHTGLDLLEQGLANLGAALKPDGILAATFVEGRRNHNGNGWLYPDCAAYRPARIGQFAAAAGLFMVRIPWYHPRQTWYLLAKNEARLPSLAQRKYLHGAVLGDPELAASWHWRRAFLRNAKSLLKRLLP